MNMAFSCVASDRCIVSIRLRLAIWVKVSPRYFGAFSRMRSKTTIVSCTEKPMTVSSAVRNSASASQPKMQAEDAEDADRHQEVVEHGDDRRRP